MANFLNNFLDANGILSNSPFGFRHTCKHSTTHAIITLTEIISKALDSEIDFRKACDVIPHKTILKNLYSYGVSLRISLFRNKKKK